MEVRVTGNFIKQRSKRQRSKAAYDVIFDEKFVVKGFFVMKKDEGDLWVAFPSARITNKDEYKQTAYPITKEFREELIELILDDYKKMIEFWTEQQGIKVKNLKEDKLIRKENSVIEANSVDPLDDEFDENIELLEDLDDIDPWEDEEFTKPKQDKNK